MKVQDKQVTEVPDTLVPEHTRLEVSYDEAVRLVNEWKSTDIKHRTEQYEHTLFKQLLDSLWVGEPVNNDIDEITSHYGGKVFHTYKTQYITTDTYSALMPDFAYHQSTDIHRIFDCAFIIELQSNNEQDDEHKAKTIIYNEAILNSNPVRTHITSVLTNMDRIVFIKTTRVNTGREFFKYKHTIYQSPLIVLKEQGQLETPGLRMLMYCLKNPVEMGYVTPPQVRLGNELYPINKYIGSGANSNVYRTIECGQGESKRIYVVKIYKEQAISSIKQEVKMHRKC